MKSCRIITGKAGAGKTSAMEDLAGQEQKPQGFLSVNIESGYILVDLSSQEGALLMAEKDFFPDHAGCWSYDKRIFDKANAELGRIDSGTVYIDEVGRLELSGGGFAPALRILAEKDVNLVIAVRDAFLEDVVKAFSLDSCPLTVSEVTGGEEAGS